MTSKKRCLNKTKKKCLNKRTKNNINTIHCKKYENIINLNLDNINLKDSNKNIKLVTLEYNNNILKYNKFLNKGAYGEVYEFSNNEYKVAIKVYKESDDNEIDIIKKINKSKISCNIVNSKLLKINNTYISVMDLMNGGLSKMNGKLNNNNIILCIKNIAKHLKCLNNNKLAYTDLKTDNILFKCKNKKNIEIALGDLGSICEIGKNNACTWNPWEYRNELGFPKCNESTMVWCLGVVLCELLNVNVILFHWSEIAKYDKIDINTYIEKICMYKKLSNHYINKSKKYSIEKLLKNMLNLDPKKRIKLNTIINNINL